MKQLYKNTQNYLDQNRASENYRRVNVFLSREEYKRLEDIKYKYRLSISIIAQIIALNYTFNDSLGKVCGNEQLYNTKNSKKTCLKLDQKFKRNDADITKGKFFNNALIIFVNKQESQYINVKDAEKIRNQIYNTFSNTIDPFWEYNNYRRYYEITKKREQQQ